MTTQPDDTKQRADLRYDFYERRLWLTRFFSINDSISATMRLFISTLAMIDGVSLETVEQVIHQVGANEQEHLNQLLLFLPQFQVLRDTATESAREASLDFDFEVKQLLNLYTLSCSLRKFVEGTLYGAMDVSMLEHEQTQTLPPVALMRECFQQVALDIEIMQRIITQRRRELGSGEMRPQAQALLVADKLAWRALAPAQHLLPPVEHTILPLTFFSQYTYIRRVPYSQNLLLIGISYDHISLGVSNVKQWMQRGGYSNVHPGLAQLADSPLPAFELMAIPHEVGHYVYHHALIEGRGTFADFSEQFREHPAYHWCEEIFADLYGCLVAGPLAALGLQSLLAATNDHAICANDGEHPTAILRPFILSEILRVLHELFPDKYPFAAVAYHLNENWAAILHYQGHRVIEGEVGRGRCTIQPHDAAPVYVADVLEAIRPIIYGFAELLLSQAAFAQMDMVPWSQNVYDDLRAYDQDMAKLTSPAFASQPIPDHRLVAIEQCQEHELHRLLSLWGDSGPLTIGGHRLSAPELDALYQANDAELQALAQKYGVKVGVLTSIRGQYAKSAFDKGDVSV